MHFLVPFPHLKGIPVIWGFGIPCGLSWTVQGPWGSGSTSWRKLCDLDLFPRHLWIRDGALSTHEGAVSGPFLVVSQALSDLCLRGLGDGSCCFQMELERLRVRKKARREGGEQQQGGVTSCSALIWTPALLRLPSQGPSPWNIHSIL